jgi:hypothetical protein
MAALTGWPSQRSAPNLVRQWADVRTASASILPHGCASILPCSRKSHVLTTGRVPGICSQVLCWCRQDPVGVCVAYLLPRGVVLDGRRLLRRRQRPSWRRLWDLSPPSTSLWACALHKQMPWSRHTVRVSLDGTLLRTNSVASHRAQAQFEVAGAEVTSGRTAARQLLTALRLHSAQMAARECRILPTQSKLLCVAGAVLHRRRPPSCTQSRSMHQRTRTMSGDAVMRLRFLPPPRSPLAMPDGLRSVRCAGC